MENQNNNSRIFSEYLTVAEAASLLGVSPSTIRNWDREGKLKAFRHPINRYRLYDPQELKNLLQLTEKDKRTVAA